VGSSAIVALLGVLLNLILGLSRVWLAMGRQGDMPRQLAQLNRAQTTPTLAVWLTGGLIALLVAIGNVKTTWSFSAFNVLIYYTLTNLAALRLPESDRRYPRWIAVVGLFSCLSLAFWVERSVWQWGIALIAVGCLGKVWRDRG
jgi:basic amino acid/polyamine antiporter, APA family